MVHLSYINAEERSRRCGKVRLTPLHGTVQKVCTVQFQMYFWLHWTVCKHIGNSHRNFFCFSFFSIQILINRDRNSMHINSVPSVKRITLMTKFFAKMGPNGRRSKCITFYLIICLIRARINSQFWFIEFNRLIRRHFKLRIQAF